LGAVLALAVAVVVAGWAGLGTGPASAAIIEADDRQPLTGALRAQFAGVGLVFSQATGAAGTGALVLRRDLVVTAAHLFFHSSGQPVAPLETWRFLVGDLVNGPYDSYAIVELYTPSGRPFMADGENDVAILRLARPLPPSIAPLALPSDSAALADYEGPAYLVGFHADREGAMAPQIGACAVRGRGVATWLYGDDHPLVYHDCDTAGHSSGAPLIVLEDGRPVIGAVHSAERSDADFRAYDAETNYNFAVRVDARIISLMLSLTQAQR
jgi:V8-like Glu-specific endopeptidase